MAVLQLAGVGSSGTQRELAGPHAVVQRSMAEEEGFRVVLPW